MLISGPNLFLGLLELDELLLVVVLVLIFLLLDVGGTYAFLRRSEKEAYILSAQASKLSGSSYR